MWWTFVHEFYKPTQLATKNMHSYADHPYYNSPRTEYEIFEDNLQAIRDAAVAASDMAPRAPSICDNNDLQPFLNRLADEGKTAFAIWDNVRGFHGLSGNFEAVTGIPASMMAGGQWIMALTSDNQYQAHRMLEIALEEQLPSQILVQTKAVSEFPSRSLIMEMKPSQKDDRHVMVLFYDVTVQKQLEEALTKAEVSLKKANRGRSAFLSCMSHELRTPLNAIMGFSQMMRDGVLGEVSHPEYSEYINHIHDSGAELLTKISTLLDIAALDSGGMAPTPHNTSLLQILEELRTMHTHAAFASGMTIAVDVKEDTQLHIDGRMMMGALSHIIANSIKYGRKDSTIHISARVQKDDGIVIAVRDRGEGLSPTRLSAIREALKAEATYFQMNGDGIGLGLSMAKELMQRQGGRVTIDSMPAQGTIVCLHVPQEALRESADTLLAAHAQSLPAHP